MSTTKQSTPMPHRLNLLPGSRYRVRTANGRKRVERIYKWPEVRFGDIPCHVFTSAAPADLVGEWDGKSLRLTGSRIPAGEISIPEYDLAEATLLQ